VLFLVFTGGEFFMRRDADEILRAARRRKFAVKLLTTGHFINDERADLIAELGAIEVSMSCYAGDAAVHEHVTNVKGSWDRTIAAARRLIARGVHVTLKTPIMSINVDSLKRLKDVGDALGAHIQFDPKVTAREDGSHEPMKLRVDDATLRSFYGSTELGIFENQCKRFESGVAERPLDSRPCVAGIETIGIDPQGIVTACHTIPIPAGDLRKQSLREIWETSAELARYRHLTWRNIEECNTCDVRAFCQRCHSMAYLEDGKLDGPSTEACRHAVILRDLLRDEGVIPADHDALPPPLQRGRTGRPVKIRPAALRVIA
jgi:radical SAM protein with 4Fe4S-binding SPASM domain